jgi:hypothetical protein
LTAMYLNRFLGRTKIRTKRIWKYRR